MRRALSYYRRPYLAVAAGAAVACAVLTGALLVGDSVTGSLRDLTRERLGGIDHAIAAGRFFDADLATRIAADPAFDERFDDLAPAILLRASARHADSRRRASGVGLQGVDESFFHLFANGRAGPGGDGADDGDGPDPATPFADADQAVFAPVAINRSLAEALGAAVGDDVLLSLRRWSEVPAGSLLARDDTSAVVETLRATVVSVLSDAGLGSFGLRPHQSQAMNAFLPLGELQRALDQEGQVNSLLVAIAGDGDDGGSPADDAALADLLRRHLELADVGIEVTTAEAAGAAPHVRVESAEYVLRPAVETALGTATEPLAADQLPILTYLANELRVGGRSVPYSTVTALDVGTLDVSAAGPFGELRRTDGTPAPPVADDEILLNTWTAERLTAEVGDTVEMAYFQVGEREELRERRVRLRLAGVVEMVGLAADEALSQEFPGIAGTADMSDWDPPFPIDLGLVGDEDEAYWDEWRDTPKAFVSLATGQRLWQTRWGRLTASRLVPAADGDLGRLRRDLIAGLSADLDLDPFGLRFEAVKRAALDNTGVTPFGVMFIGFSIFLIVSAALLVGLLFRLGIEQRAKEIGTLLAVGYPRRRVARRLLGEGLVVAGAGTLVGLGGAVLYAWLMMYGLRTWWLPAVGTSRLTLHVGSLSLVVGLVASLAVVAFSIRRTVRRVSRLSAARLLKGETQDAEDRGRAGRAARWVATIGLGIALLCLAGGFAAGKAAGPILFAVGGPALLAGLLAFFTVYTDRARPAALARPGTSAIFAMAVANGRRHLGRSLLAATLIACACFVIVTVGVRQHDVTRDELGKSSGTGGFALIAEADVALQHDLASEDGRFELGLPDSVETRLAEAHIMPFRLVPGDDTSCLNLYQPRQPRLLGVPDELVARGGFTFTGAIDEVGNPWSLLDADLGPGVIPAIGDAESTQWILQLPLGDELTMTDEHGDEIRLRLVATLATSIFQSELLISEEQLLRHFPSRSGFPYFLIEAPASSIRSAAEALETSLEDYGFDAQPTAERLAAFHAVKNTYLQTFRSLGGLGLLLGTLGLAVVLLRNVLERRGELAALRAFGYRRPALVLMVTVENVLLLAAGLAIGTVAALVTNLPHLVDPAARVPWTALALTLGLILAFGLAACAVAARSALAAPLLPALKADA